MASLSTPRRRNTDWYVNRRSIIAIAAANAGKDIYCEKPLCQSIHEARAMVNAVRKNKRVRISHRMTLHH